MKSKFKDSPVEHRRKELPRGDAQWTAFASVYTRMAKAADAMGKSDLRGNDFHVETMAVMGTGHEETMKYQLQLLYVYGWL